jgi:hypothetical protein
MALSKDFERGLDKLFERRTAWLHRAIGKKQPGALPKFTKAKVKPQLERVTQIARNILIQKRGRIEFLGSIASKRQWQVKGKAFGIDARKREFKRWYEREIGGKNCVYVFWSKRACAYVGRTLHGKGRPAGWFDRHWFSHVTRIDIYTVRATGLVSKVECLAIDRFNPRHNKYSAARPKYSQKCPVCSTTKKIRQDLRGLFRLR